ncbi:MAG: hypothetical protein P1P76_01420 [Anaerolineales bacterium]|nr:hypothetical protein [Anaerolineales bacterium]
MAATMTKTGGATLADRIQALPDPYRGNAIEWLQLCTQTQMMDLEKDIDHFLETLNPSVRAKFIFQTGKLLEKAIFYFGRS